MGLKSAIFLTLCVFLLSFIPLLWFSGDAILLGYDNVYPLDPLPFLKDRFFSWTSTQGFGLDQSGQQGSLIIHFIDSIPQFFGVSIQSSQKIVFSLWFFLLIFSPYLFIFTLERNGFVKSRYLRYIFPVLYAINFYVLQAWWVAERTKFSLMVATPLILAIIFPLIKDPIGKKSILRKSIACAFVLTIFNGGGWGGLSLYGGLLAVLSVFYLFHLLSFIYKKKLKQAVLFSVFFVLFAGWYLLFNAYTLLPFLLSTLKEYSGFVNSAGGIGGLINWTRYLSENTSFLNLLRLQGIPDWYNSSVYHPYSLVYFKNNIFIFLSFLFPFFIFLSILVNYKREKIILLFFIFLLLITLLLTAGAHSPFGFIYEAFMRKIPGFVIFRSAFFKFGYAYWFAASVLIGLFLSRILDYLSLRFNKNLIPGVVLLLFIAGILLYHFPYLKGDIFRIDKSKVYSRVEVPSYVYEFADWWSKHSGNDKILLLPKLNDNWLFEQYTWGYLSLFPVLGNFANSGIVENTDQLTSNEIDLVNKLYESIDSEDYAQTSYYASSLGITYFLVRKDFYHNLEGQETESPKEIEEKFKHNFNMRLVKSFGEWILYQHKVHNPLFFATNKSIVFDGSGSSIGDLSQNLLPLDEDAYNKYPFLFRKDLIYPECLSCKAESEEVSVQIPKPKILLDSSLYDFIILRDKLKKPKVESYEQRLYRYVGEMLKSAGQISELIYQEKGDIYVNQSRTRYIDLINELSQGLKDNEKIASNPYVIAIIIENYLNAQNNFLQDLLQKSSLKSEQINIEKILYEINRLNDELKDFYGEKDFNIYKYYRYTITRPKEYEIKVLRSSLGVLKDDDVSKISIQLDNNETTISTRFDDEYINFGKVFLDSGSHVLRLILPDQKNIVTSIKQERISGSNCFSSYVEDFSSNSKYNISFSSKNNFDPTFFYFVDGGRKFSPAHIGYLSLAGEQIKQNRVIVAPSRVRLDDRSDLLRVSLCAFSLNESLYNANIKNLKTVFLTEPEIILESDLNNDSLLTLPTVDFLKIDQTHYKVFIKNAVDPYILSFTQRYSSGWQARIDGENKTFLDHRSGGGYENVWISDKRGNYTIDTYYNPQKYFYIGSVISIVSLMGSISFVCLIKTKHKKN